MLRSKTPGKTEVLEAQQQMSLFQNRLREQNAQLEMLRQKVHDLEVQLESSQKVKTLKCLYNDDFWVAQFLLWLYKPRCCFLEETCNEYLIYGCGNNAASGLKPHLRLEFLYVISSEGSGFCCRRVKFCY